MREAFGRKLLTFDIWPTVLQLKVTWGCCTDRIKLLRWVCCGSTPDRYSSLSFYVTVACYTCKLAGRASHLHFNQLLSWTRVNIGLARVAATFVRAALGFTLLPHMGLIAPLDFTSIQKNDALVRFGKFCYLFINQYCQLAVLNFDFTGQFCFTVDDSLTAGNKIPLKNLYFGTICEGKECNNFLHDMFNNLSRKCSVKQIYPTRESRPTSKRNCIPP